MFNVTSKTISPFLLKMLIGISGIIPKIYISLLIWALNLKLPSACNRQSVLFRLTLPSVAVMVIVSVSSHTSKVMKPLYAFPFTFLVSLLKTLTALRIAVDDVVSLIRFPNSLFVMSYGVSRFSGARSCKPGSMMSTVMPMASAICWMVT